MEVIIDASGRDASGRSFGRLAEEYERGLSWAQDEPVPFEELAGPYRELREGLRQSCEQLARTLRRVGDGQVLMAAVNERAEQA
ncbi:hypothetical protein [Nonomuraea sediminis]|uniref:hypothetical protein n=1 Tax=Nonomuraea sediminis TaxID=2835864 RepID=UPI001BDC6767|nr:hypothetical protein [Nonomuraea sediminis]